MKLARPILLGLAGVLVALWGDRRAEGLRREINSERTAAAIIQSRIAILRRQREASLSDLALAQKELRTLRPLSPGDVDQARKDELRSWLERVKRLKQLFVEHPDQRIPELELLTDDDWIRIARWTSLDDDAAERGAMGDARNAAKRLLMPLLGRALLAYAEAHQNLLPAQATDLAPYLSDPRATAALSRYEMLTTAAVSPFKPANAAAISEIAPVDPDTDSKITISNNGGGSIMLPPVAWIPGFNEARIKAYQAYAEANKGAVAPSAPDVIPFFNPPLDPTTQQKFLQSVQTSLRDF
jgi:hypothetical protein